MAPKNIFAKCIIKDEFVIIDDAVRGVGMYKCCDIGCGGKVFVKRGIIKSAHFSHHCSIAGAGCPRQNGGETREHYTCKHHIANNLEDYAFIKHQCIKCCVRRHYNIDDCRANVEKRVPGSTRTADVLLTRALHAPPSIVEVFHSHAVDDKKRREMEALGVSVIEVTTEEIEYAISHPSTSGAKFVVKTTDYVLGTCFRCEYEAYRLREWQCEVERILSIEAHWSNECSKYIHHAHGDLWQKCGMKRAKEYEEEVRKIPRTYRYDKDTWEGKCRSCTANMFSDSIPKTQSVSLKSYSQLEWNEISAVDHPRSRVKYPVSDIVLCAKCVIKCIGCYQWMPLKKARQHGACTSCYIQFGLGDYVAEDQARRENIEKEKEEVRTKHMYEILIKEEAVERKRLQQKEREAQEQLLERMAIDLSQAKARKVERYRLSNQRTQDTMLRLQAERLSQSIELRSNEEKRLKYFEDIRQQRDRDNQPYL
jgi:hypothetical protein